MASKPPPPPDFTDPPPPPKSGSSGSSGGSSGGSRSSVTDLARSQYLSGLASTYVGLWGTKPPPGYLEGIAARGMNVFEFEAHERAKPAFKFSPRYNEERLGIGLSLAERFGSLG